MTIITGSLANAQSNRAASHAAYRERWRLLSEKKPRSQEEEIDETKSN